MKKNVLLGLGAMTLCVPLFLSSCSSSDDATETPVNPSSNEAVKTSFTLSVGLPKSSSSAKAMSRVSEATAQAQSDVVFRGIEDINLIPFAQTGKITSSNTRLGTNIQLPGSPMNTYLSSAAQGTDHATVYKDVTIPVGTTSFLFYGKAIDATAGTAISSDADYHKYGTLKSEGLSQEPTNIKFTPVQISTATAADTKATSIANALTTIANTQIKLSDGSTVVKWGESNNANNTLYPLYKQFIKIEAGSSASVRAALQTLYITLKPNTDEMSKAIIANIKTVATISDADELTLNSDYTGYPENINLPDGVALVKWNATSSKFEPNLTGSTTSGIMSQKPTDLVYPANLQYYDNTTIQTSNSDQSGLYTSSNTWSTILASYTDGTSVSTTTRSVALKDQIQYAVGRLDLTVQAASATLKDAEGVDVPITNGSNPSFPISAVFVGGQKQVGFDFTQSTATSTTEYTIYDNAVPDTWASTGLTTSASAKNYTLALETAEKTPVYVAVEFTNNSGLEFMGKDGYIGKGAKFYLIAQLDPTGSDVTKATTGGTMNQVFKQDYFTTATLTVNANSSGTTGKGIAAAYNVLPDLRTPKLSIGMSVNLEWQKGLTFNKDI